MNLNKQKQIARKQVSIVGMPSTALLENARVSRTFRIKQLRKLGLIIRNNGESIYVNRISPGCIDCFRGTGITVYSTEECNRNCFFYPGPRSRKNSFARIIPEINAQKEWMLSFAITGGEPLLDLDVTLGLLRFAKVSGGYTCQTRLYTNGDFLNQKILRALRKNKLNEIRISIKPGEKYLKKVVLAKQYIPRVMVEMPVFPDEEQRMKKLLTRLDTIGIFGVNLLEFVFCSRNAKIYKKRGYKLMSNKMNNFSHLSPWDYSVYKSEEVCFNLLEFAVRKKLSIGVHYCSLNNKRHGNPRDRLRNREIGKKLMKYLKNHKDFKGIYPIDKKFIRV